MDASPERSAGSCIVEYTTYADTRTLQFSLNLLRRDGEVYGIVVFGKDITELRAALHAAQELNRTLEQRVEQRTAELQRLYDSAPTGYHSLDAEGRVVMMNRTELQWLGYTRDEVIGRPAQDFLSPASQAIFAAEFPHYIQCGWLHDFELEFQRKDGSVFPVLITSEALYDEQGNFVMSRATAFDNTDRKAIDDTLRHANLEMQRAVRLKDEFLANMSHELRTPLTSILTLNEVLLDHIYGPLTDRQESALQNIDTSARHLLALINDLLDLSKSEPFIQLDSLLVREHQGTGLGLALVKQLAEQHGGSVTATSGGPGLGSCFTITLPYAAQ